LKGIYELKNFGDGPSTSTGTHRTERIVFPGTILTAAVMVVVPKPTPVARPPALIVATAGFDEVQRANAVRS
jgi:hypothetical protein